LRASYAFVASRASRRLWSSFTVLSDATKIGRGLSRPYWGRGLDVWAAGQSTGSHRLGLENSRNGRLTGTWCRELRATASVNSM